MKIKATGARNAAVVWPHNFPPLGFADAWLLRKHDYSAKVKLLYWL